MLVEIAKVQIAHAFSTSNMTASMITVKGNKNLRANDIADKAVGINVLFMSST